MATKTEKSPSRVSNKKNGKAKVALKRTCDDAVTQDDNKKKNKQYRGNLVKTHRLFEDIKPDITREHEEAMRQTPFFNFWKPFLMGKVELQQVSKSDKVIRAIVARYSKRDGGFRFGEKVLKLTPKDAELIFGLRPGEIVIPVVNSADKPTSEFAGRLDALNGPKQKMNVDDLNEQLSKLVKRRGERDLKDFVKLMCAHSIYTVFYSHSGNTVPYWILELVDDLDRVNKIAWSQYVVDKLQTSLDEHSVNPDCVIGCVLLLGYVMLEHTHLVKRLKPDEFPRFASWRMNDFRMSFLEMDEWTLSDQVDIAALRETKDEKMLYEQAEGNISTASICNEDEIGQIGNIHNLSPTSMALIVPGEASDQVALKPAEDEEDKGCCDQSKGELLSEIETLRKRVADMEKLIAYDKLEREKEKELMIKKLNDADQRYNEEVKKREEVEELLENANVEISVHSFTQCYAANKSISELDISLSDLKEEIMAKDQIIESLRSEVAARKLNEEINNVADANSERLTARPEQYTGGTVMQSSRVINVASITSETNGKRKLVNSDMSAKRLPKKLKQSTTKEMKEVPRLTATEKEASEYDEVDPKLGSIIRGVIQKPRKRPVNKKYADHLDLAIAATTSSSGGRKLLAKNEYEVARFLSDEDFEMVQLIYYQSPKNMAGTVMKVPHADHKVIVFEDVYDILTNDKLSSMYMDCYFAMLTDYLLSSNLRDKLRKRTSPPLKNRISGRVCFMPANFWTFLEENHICNIDQEVNTKLDEHLQNPFDHIVVAVNCDLKWSVVTVVAMHWTLMVLDVKTNRWAFYNSLITGKEEDEFKNKAVIIAKYIDGYLEHGRDQLSWSINRNVRLQYCITPKQMPNTNECGVIVCYVLKQLIDGKKLIGRFYQTRLWEFRANLIKWALHAGI